ATTTAPHRSYLLFSYTTPAPSVLSPLSLHDALPICRPARRYGAALRPRHPGHDGGFGADTPAGRFDVPVGQDVRNRFARARASGAASRDVVFRSISGARERGRGPRHQRSGAGVFPAGVSSESKYCPGGRHPTTSDRRLGSPPTTLILSRSEE